MGAIRTCTARNWPLLITKRLISNSKKPASESKSNVDLKDVKHHASMVDQWWDLKGPMKGLHSMNELRVPFIRDGLIRVGKVNLQDKNTSTPLKKFHILEVGCGGGILTEPLARLGAKVTGLDASCELITLAQGHLLTEKNILRNITYTTNNIEEFAKSNMGCYDAVVISEVLEHIKAKDLFLEACVKTLKDQGSIFVTTMNRNFISWLGGIVLAENVLRIVPRNTHDWEKFIAPHETQRLLEINNCYTRRVHGMFYKFWSNQWIWCSSTEINYALHAIKQSDSKKLEKNVYHDK